MIVGILGTILLMLIWRISENREFWWSGEKEMHSSAVLPEREGGRERERERGREEGREGGKEGKREEGRERWRERRREGGR